MQPESLGLLLATLAGGCTCLGALLFVCFSQRIGPRTFAFFMSLSAGVMFYVSFIEILPEALFNFQLHFEGNQQKAKLLSSLLFFFGWLSATWFDWLLHITIRIFHLTKRVEDISKKDTESSELELSGNADSSLVRLQQRMRPLTDASDSGWDGGKSDDSSERRLVLKRFKEDNERFLEMGLLTALVLGAHNLPEGVATYTGAISDPQTGMTLAMAIGIHNIPEGFSVSVPVFLGTRSVWKGMLVASVSGFAEPLAALCVFLFFDASSITPITFGVLFALVAGIMANLSMKELFPAALRYDPSDRFTSWGLISGMALMACSLVIFEFSAGSLPGPDGQVALSMGSKFIKMNHG
ncbi:MAG: hypothetical protein KVP17_001036 [Porospora cf. gigantea B]|uniref:uncharacterized protein n=2 Tax=Porospora cf. gigantea B TaxID=2853592 RepID=UPI003571B9AF|nr:MAG: hypothetical protein KVP17_001036 [Porospora cf. gigantea B]